MTLQTEGSNLNAFVGDRVLLVLNLEIFLRVFQGPKRCGNLWQELTLWSSVSAVTATSGALKDVVGAHGGSVTFTLNSTENQVDTVIWTFNTVSVAIVTRDHFKVLQNHNKKRIVFPDGIHSMKLSHLKKNDSGVYRAEIHNTSLQSPFSQEFVLCVYGKQAQL